MASWHPHRTRRGVLRRWLPILAGGFACYLGSYVAFSSWGQYVAPPAAEAENTHLAAPARWAPGEFYNFSTRRWRPSHTLPYAPLLWLDQRFWHRPHHARPDPAAP